MFLRENRLNVLVQFTRIFLTNRCSRDMAEMLHMFDGGSRHNKVLQIIAQDSVVFIFHFILRSWPSLIDVLSKEIISVGKTLEAVRSSTL